MVRLKCSTDSVSTNICLWKINTATLTAQRIIHYHIVYHELESSNLTITTKLLSHAKQAHSGYFNDQKEHSMQRVQSGRDVKTKQINDDIDDANRNIRQLN